MNKFLWTCIALGLSTGAAFATTTPQSVAVSSNHLSSRMVLQTAMTAPAPDPDGVPSGAVRSRLRYPEYGPDGTIALFPPDATGGGDN